MLPYTCSCVHWPEQSRKVAHFFDVGLLHIFFIANMATSILAMAGPKTRLKTSFATIESISKILGNWFVALDDHRAAHLLKHCRDTWTWKAGPLSTELCLRAPRLLVETFVDEVFDLNPGLVMVADALLHLQSSSATQCLFSSDPQVEARVCVLELSDYFLKVGTESSVNMRNVWRQL